MPRDIVYQESNMTRNLRAARTLLEKSYVVGIRDDGKGGHCALGALEAVMPNDYYHCDNSTPEVIQLAKFASASIRRKPWPPTLMVVQQNNELGKEQTLQMFDDAIADSIEQDMMVTTITA